MFDFIDRILGSPIAQGSVVSVLLAYARAVYDDKETNNARMLLESGICGGLTLAAGAFIVGMGWPENLSLAVGGAVGFLGVEQIRALMIRVAKRKIDNDSL